SSRASQRLRRQDGNKVITMSCVRGSSAWSIVRRRTGTVCMSPRKSELAAIEAVVCRDVGRKTQSLIEASRGELGAAVRALAQAKSVGLITGFFVPRDGVASPETDGPVGTALLAAGLA